MASGCFLSQEKGRIEPGRLLFSDLLQMPYSGTSSEKVACGRSLTTQLEAGVRSRQSQGLGLLSSPTPWQAEVQV